MNDGLTRSIELAPFSFIWSCVPICDKNALHLNQTHIFPAFDQFPSFLAYYFKPATAMRRPPIALFSLLFISTAALAVDRPSPYGTVVNKDGSMVVIYKSLHGSRAYAAKVSKQGSRGGCVKESVSAFPLRRAFIKASSKWKAGYIPRDIKCQTTS